MINHLSNMISNIPKKLSNRYNAPALKRQSGRGSDSLCSENSLCRYSMDKNIRDIKDEESVLRTIS